MIVLVVIKIWSTCGRAQACVYVCFLKRHFLCGAQRSRDGFQEELLAEVTKRHMLQDEMGAVHQEFKQKMKENEIAAEEKYNSMTVRRFLCDVDRLACNHSSPCSCFRVSGCGLVLFCVYIHICIHVCLYTLCFSLRTRASPYGRLLVCSLGQCLVLGLAEIL